MSDMSQQMKIFNYFGLKEQLEPPKDETPSEIVNFVVKSIVDDALKSKRTHVSCKKETLKTWSQSYPWLIYDDQSVLKCRICTKYKKNSPWANKGCSNIQKSSLYRHNISKEHAESVQTELLSKSCESTCVDDIDSDTEQPSVLDEDMFLFRTVYTCMKNEIPLDKVNTILELQRLNSINIPYRNLSWTTISEISHIIGRKMREKLVDQINSSDFYAILIDESTDITVSKRLSICVRYVKAGEAVTSFLANVEIPDGCAHTIVETLTSYLLSLKLNMVKCVSLATDGASVMVGKKTGVGVQLKSKFMPFITQTHCIAHRLNLAVTDSVKKDDTLTSFRSMFSTLYQFMSASTHRVNTLKTMQDLLDEPELTIKDPHSIRWLGMKRAVEAVFECYTSVLATLSNLATDNPSAKALYKYFSRYKVSLLIGLMYDVHTELGVLSCRLQEQNIMFSDVQPLVDSTVGRLEHMKEHDGLGLKDTKESIKIENKEASYKGEKLKYYHEGADSEFKKTKTAYLDRITQNIRRRIPKKDSEILQSLGTLLDPQVQTSDHADTDSALEPIIALYCVSKKTSIIEGNLTEGCNLTKIDVSPIVQKDNITKEWPGVCAMLTGSYKTLSLQNFCKRILLKHKTQFPAFAKLAEIALCFQVTSVECERSFSQQNRLKNKFRSSFGNEALGSLLMVMMIGSPVPNFNPADSVKTWLRKKRRKKRLMDDYKPRECTRSKRKKLS